MGEAKPFWKSKTFWFNVLALLLTVASAFGYQDFKPDPWVQDLATVIIIVVNLILRFVTSTPVRFR
jgi:membrane protein YdbS with pleckstrin-like domain